MKAPNGEIVYPNESHNSARDARRALETAAFWMSHPNPIRTGPGPRPAKALAAAVKRITKKVKS